MSSNQHVEAIVLWANQYKTIDQFSDLAKGNVLCDLVSTITKTSFPINTTSENETLVQHAITMVKQEIDHIDKGEYCFNTSTINKSEIVQFNEENADELIKLIEVIVFLSVRVDTPLVKKIMTWSDQIQKELMEIIQRIDGVLKETALNPPLSETTVRGSDTHMAILEEQENKIKEFALENEQLKREMEVLKVALERVTEDKTNNEESLQESKQMQKLTDDLTKQVKDANRRVEMSEDQINDLQIQLRQNETKATEMKQLFAKTEMELNKKLEEQRDNIDILEEQSKELAKLKVKEKRWEEKFVEFGSLQHRMKELEDKNFEQMEKLHDQESKVEMVESLQTQVSSLKEKNMDLETSLSETTAKLEVRDEELENLTASIQLMTKKIKELEDTNQTNISEIAHLEEQLENGNGAVAGALSGALDPTPLHIKEKLFRLEKENENLKAKSNHGEDVGTMKSDLEQAIAMKDRYEQSSKDALKKVAELESKLQAFESSAKEGAEQIVEENATLKQEINTLTAQLESKDKKNAARIDELDANTKEVQRLTTELKEQMNIVDASKKKTECMASNLQSKTEEIQLAQQREKDLLEEVEQLKFKLNASSKNAENVQQQEATAVKNLIAKIKDCEQEIALLVQNNEKLELDKKKLETAVASALAGINNKTQLSVQTYKDRISELENQKQVLLEMKAKQNNQQKLEEQLMMSAFYEIGLDIQRQVAKGKGMASHPELASPHQQTTAWLGKQRQKSMPP